MWKFLTYVLMAVSLVTSCNAVSSLLHDDQVVAKVGKAKLYRSELERYIPDMVSKEDSSKLAASFINSWAMDRLYMNVAESELSKTEQDVTAELETYRMSLLKFRYEQRYIANRLDTLVTEAQIRDYYEGHNEEFTLNRPVMKVRFLHIMKDAVGVDKMIKLMGSDEYEDLERLDTLVKSVALRYFDKSDTWMDAGRIADEFGMGYEEMLSKMQKDIIRVDSEERGDLMVAYVCDIQQKGIAPLEYCSQNIRDIILSGRKRDLVNALEQDLLDSALENKIFEIY